MYRNYRNLSMLQTLISSNFFQTCFLFLPFINILGQIPWKRLEDTWGSSHLDLSPSPHIRIQTMSEQPQEQGSHHPPKLLVLSGTVLFIRKIFKEKTTASWFKTNLNSGGQLTSYFLGICFQPNGWVFPRTSLLPHRSWVWVCCLGWCSHLQS